MELSFYTVAADEWKLRKPKDEGKMKVRRGPRRPNLQREPNPQRCMLGGRFAAEKGKEGKGEKEVEGKEMSTCCCQPKPPGAESCINLKCLVILRPQVVFLRFFSYLTFYIFYRTSA